MKHLFIILGISLMSIKAQEKKSSSGFGIRAGLWQLLIFTSLISCDLPTAIVVDEKKEFTLSTECGTIKIQGSSVINTEVIISCTFNGEYTVNTNSLKIEPLLHSDTIIIHNIDLNGKNLTETMVKLHEGDVMSIHCSFRTKEPYKQPSRIMYILPSDFITCNSEQIISDTLTVKLK